MANIFESIFEKVAFIGSEADLVFEKKFTDAFKENEDFGKVVIEEKKFRNNCASSGH